MQIFFHNLFWSVYGYPYFNLTDFYYFTLTNKKIREENAYKEYQKRLKNIKNDGDKKSLYMKAIIENDLHLIQYLNVLGYDYNSQGMPMAAACNNFPMIQCMIQNGAKNWKQAMLEAANHRHWNMVQFLIHQKNFDDDEDWNQVNVSYAFNDNVTVVQIMFNQSHTKHYNGGGIMKEVIGNQKDMVMMNRMLKNDLKVKNLKQKNKKQKI